jgi:hypothetical protein
LQLAACASSGALIRTLSRCNEMLPAPHDEGFSSDLTVLNRQRVVVTIYLLPVVAIQVVSIERYQLQSPLEAQGDNNLTD